MEAALRTAVSILNPDEKFSKLEFDEVRGLEGVKEASYTINGLNVKVAVVNGLNNAKALCDKIRNGEADYQFVEVMTCPGGCVMGGGQPIKATFVKHKNEVAKARAEVLYTTDKAMTNRRSHKNISVNEVYATDIGTPNGHAAHEMLHTSYEAKPRYVKE